MLPCTQQVVVMSAVIVAAFSVYSHKVSYNTRSEFPSASLFVSHVCFSVRLSIGFRLRHMELRPDAFKSIRIRRGTSRLILASTCFVVSSAFFRIPIFLLHIHLPP